MKKLTKKQKELLSEIHDSFVNSLYNIGNETQKSTPSVQKIHKRSKKKRRLRA